MDIAENLTQIGRWTLKGFSEQQSNIELFLKLTRKDVDALSTHPMPSAFKKTYEMLCGEYSKLEAEYKDGITDHRTWADGVQSLAVALTEKSHHLA